MVQNEILQKSGCGFDSYYACLKKIIKIICRVGSIGTASVLKTDMSGEIPAIRVQIPVTAFIMPPWSNWLATSASQAEDVGFESPRRYFRRRSLMDKIAVS